MSDVKCARMLLDAATRDVDALRVMHRSREISDEIFGFHVQQATEKLLKAWIALLGEAYPLTHSIEDLLDFLAGRGAVVFRYAGIGPDTEPIDREGTFALVVALLDRVDRALAEVESPRPRGPQSGWGTWRISGRRVRRFRRRIFRPRRNFGTREDRPCAGMVELIRMHSGEPEDDVRTHVMRNSAECVCANNRSMPIDPVSSQFRRAACPRMR